MRSEISDPADCGMFRKFLYAFQAGEIPAEEGEILRRHLESCEACRTYMAVEDSMLEGIRSAMEPAQAPAGLEARIRSALAEEAPAPGMRRGWSRIAPWLAAAAAALLLVALLVPGLLLEGDRSGPAPGPVVKQAIREGIIVDYDCDRMGYPVHLQHLCDFPEHLNALKLDNGRYIQFSLGEEISRRLVLDRKMRGSRVAVRGDYYPGIRTMEVVEFRSTGGSF